MRIAIVAAAVLGLFTAAAQAQPSSIGSERFGQKPTDWTLDVGPGVVMAPWFEGSAYYRVLPIPNLDIRYQRDKIFISARDGIGATLLDMEGVKVGPIFRYKFPRYEWDGPGLYGTGFVPFTIEGGGFVRYDLPYLSAKVEVRRGLGGSNGLIFDALLDGKARLADNFFLSAGPRLAVTDGTYNQAYFGINAVQSAMSGYQQYWPGAGLKSVGVGTSAVWHIDEKLTGVAFGAWNRLTDVAASSPLVTGPAGSLNQFIVGAAITWRFSW